MPTSLTDWLGRSLHKQKPFEYRKQLEGLLTFTRTTHLKQVSNFTLGKKQNDFCQVKFNKSGPKFNIYANGESMVICFTILSTIKSPWIHHLHLLAIATYCYIIATLSLHATIDVYHRNLLLFNAATHRYILIRNFEEKMLLRFCVRFFVLCRWFRQSWRERGGGLNRKKLRL